MSEFVFLYRNELTGAPQASPEQMQQTMQKWMAWMKELGEKGHSRMRPAAGAHRQGGKGKPKSVTTARSPRRRTSSAATRWSRPRISGRPWKFPWAVRFLKAGARWKCVRS